jgi:hypothetical protein
VALDPAAREALDLAVARAEEGDEYELNAIQTLRDYPVAVEQFVEDPAYLGSDALYPAIMDELVALTNPEQEDCKYRARLWTSYSEAVLTGGIGSGKSTLALYATAYQLYVLSCFRAPHALFELDPTSEIVFAFQNRTERLARAVGFDRFRAMVAGSPYFRRHFAFDPKVKSELRFPNRVVVKPAAGNGEALIGQNVFGGVIDEVNFMDVVQRSQRSMVGADYDQAMALYLSIARRRTSRFLRHGRLPGLLCLVSSRRYPGQFTDRKEVERRRQLAEDGATSIYLFDRRVWEVKPPGTYSGDTFRVFAGDEARQPRVLALIEEIPEADDHLVIEVPVEHRPEFEADVVNALRDLAGVSALAAHPFFTDREAVAACFDRVPSVLDRDDCDFEDTMIRFYPDTFDRREIIRWAHLDLSLTGDATGVVVGHVSEFVEVERGDAVELMPVIRVDLVLRVLPPRGGEVRYDKIRALLYALLDRGMNIRFVSADSYQSADTLQQLRLKGMATGRQSVDRDPRPYEFLKAAIYDGRLDLPEHEHLHRELLSLERDTRTGKVDHLPGGSKDLADALAAVVYGLSIRLDVWSQHGVYPHRDAPRAVEYVRKVGRELERAEADD